MLLKLLLLGMLRFGHFYGFCDQVKVGAMHGWAQKRRGWEFENAVIVHNLGRQIAHATGRSRAFLLDIIRHDAIVLINNVALETMALAVLNSTGTAYIWPFSCVDPQVDIQITLMLRGIRTV